MWAYEFMQNAVWGGLIVATICGLVSVFVILRQSGFAAHALGHMSLTGASAAVLIGIPSLIGQLILNCAAAMIIGLIGDKVRKNDLAVGVVLTFVLGLGAYCLFLFQNSYAGGVMSILFGNIFAISKAQLGQLGTLGLVVVISLGVISRPLLLASIDPVVATSKQVATQLLAMVFFIILAITVSMACQIVGALLVFVLLIIPGAIGLQWGESIYAILAISTCSANLGLLLALIIAYQFNLPVSFCLTMLLCCFYFIGSIANSRLFARK